MALLRKLPVPKLAVNSIYDVSPEALRARGVTLLLMDLDNTLAPYSTDEASPELRDWLAAVKAAGIEPFLFSNNKGNRPEIFAKQLNVEFVKLARKPRQAMLRQVLAQKNAQPSQTALIGDQIYTDALCGSLGGLYTIVVRPISLKNPLHALRYAAEFPFRLAYKVKHHD